MKTFLQKGELLLQLRVDYITFSLSVFELVKWARFTNRVLRSKEMTPSVQKTAAGTETGERLEALSSLVIDISPTRSI